MMRRDEKRRIFENNAIVMGGGEDSCRLKTFFVPL